MYILESWGSLQWTLLLGWEFLPLPQPLQVFSVRGFETLFPHTGTLGSSVCFIPQLFLPVYLHTNVGPPALPAAISPSLLTAALPSLVLWPPAAALL